MPETRPQPQDDLLVQLAQHLHETYRGCPGDLTDPAKQWQDLDDYNKQGWLGDAADIIDIMRRVVMTATAQRR